MISASEWKTINNNLAEASDIAEHKNNNNLIELLDKTFDAIEKRNDNESALEYATRIVERAKCMGEWIQPNRVTESYDMFTISNYDYDTFVWAKKQKLDGEIDNITIKLPKAKLTKPSIEALRKKVNG